MATVVGRITFSKVKGPPIEAGPVEIFSFPRSFFQEQGAIGGHKARHRLSSEQARRMGILSGKSKRAAKANAASKGEKA